MNSRSLLAREYATRTLPTERPGSGNEISVHGSTTSNCYSLLEEPKSEAMCMTTVELGVLARNDMIFRVGHKPEYEACFVTDSCNVIATSIWVTSRICQRDLIVFAQMRKCFVACSEPTFAMGDRAVNVFGEVLCPYTAF